MTGLSLSSTALRVKFGTTPLSVVSLDNLKTGARLCRGGSQSLLVRMPRAVSEPVFLDRCESVESASPALRSHLRDATGNFEATLTIVPSPNGLAFTVAVKTPDPLWVVEYRLEGLDLEEVVLPALGGQSLSASMPEEMSLTYKYPFWLNAQFVLGMARKGGIWLRSMDTDPVFKFIRVRRVGGKFDISYCVEASGPLRSKTLEATWYLDCFAGNWKEPVRIHRAWLERSFSVLPLSSDRSLPAWARDIDFVLEIWGIGRESAAPCHTFEQMIGRLRKWKKLHAPARTLVYLPGFAERGIDSHAPSYGPSPRLGGPGDFKKLVMTAHELRYHVMVHTNVLGMTFDHPLFGRFERHQVVDVFGRRQGWGLDIDGDWLAEPFFAYINPGANEWGDLMEQVIGDLVGSFGVDGVFLDQTLLAFNVGSGPNFVTGMRSHILRLRKAFPGTLFAGEGLHEHVVKALPMAQIHGIDSITETHGMAERVRWRKVHPVSGYLFGRYTRFTAHLLTHHPSHPMFAFQESSYGKLGVIPALCLYRNDQALDGPEVRRMIRRASRLRETQ